MPRTSGRAFRPARPFSPRDAPASAASVRRRRTALRLHVLTGNLNQSATSTRSSSTTQPNTDQTVVRIITPATLKKVPDFFFMAIKALFSEPRILSGTPRQTSPP